MDLEQELKVLLKGDVATDEATLKTYSHDASLFEVKPRVVVFPKDVEDIKKLVVFAKEKGLSITARGGGSDMTGGPLTESIVLDTTRYLNQVKEIGPSTSSGQGGFAVVESGVFYRDFEKEAEKKNLLFPSFPASKDLCSWGGMIANNSGGEKTLRYGKTEQYVESLKVVLADGKEYEIGPLARQELEQKIAQNDFEGEIYRTMWNLIETNEGVVESAKPNVSKNSSGYALWNVWDKNKGVFNLAKLFVGSQGTLGIITEIKVRLVVPQKHESLLVMFLPSLDPLVETVQAVLKHNPETFESYDDHTLQLAARFFFDFLKIMKGNIISLAFRFLPEFLMVLRGGVPKLILLAEFTADTDKEARQQAEAARKEVGALGVKSRIASSRGEIEKYLTIRRQSFSLLRKHPHGLRTAPFIDDIIVKPEYLEDFLPRLNKILGQYPQVIYTIAGHVGNGNFHIIPLMDLAKPYSGALIKEIAEKVFALTLEFKGSLTAEHNDGLIRTPFVKDMFGEEVYKLFEQTKYIFDPQNIFNPGKKVNGSWDYAMSHLAA
ncbi:MAG: FAD-binding oxidoreductase [Candidatus Wildermuthbacteria bacterium]|nr:FAD-binding oxidoreductase [Candidatus Wildermuthbacteria bacterium]